jgi:hypothetical protein
MGVQNTQLKIMGSYLAQFPASIIRDNVKMSLVEESSNPISIELAGRF